MKYKIAKIFENNKPTDKYNLKENEKTFSGRIQISKKIQEKWGSSIEKSNGYAPENNYFSDEMPPF
ncbi:MAG: hypothetical protein LW595_06445 [Rickettsiales bacterium]|nr:hypothetical protein [Rickettsiales bacterium]